jgi:Ca-activated chloride channel family protein
MAKKSRSDAVYGPPGEEEVTGSRLPRVEEAAASLQEALGSPPSEPDRVLADEEAVEGATLRASPVDLLGQQLANGLWAGTGPGSEPVRQARATALALLELLRQGITSGHALHGGQVKKAVEALLALLPSLGEAPEVAEFVLGVAWLVSAGPRTRGRISQAARPLAGLSARLADEATLRQHVDTLATR